MSVFCPSSFKWSKVKRNYPLDMYTRTPSYNGLASSIGNLSIDQKRCTTLMEIVEDYFPTSALELPVKEGELVTYIKSDGMWIYVRAENGSDGYIPRRICRLLDSEEIPQHNNKICSDVGYYSDNFQREYFSNTNHTAKEKLISLHMKPTSCQFVQEPSLPLQQCRSERLYYSTNDLNNQSTLESSDSSWSNRSSSIESQNHNQSKENIFPNVGLKSQKRHQSYHTVIPKVGSSSKPHHSSTLSLLSNFELYNHSISCATSRVCGRKCKEDCDHKTLNRIDSIRPSIIQQQKRHEQDQMQLERQHYQCDQLINRQEQQPIQPADHHHPLHEEKTRKKLHKSFVINLSSGSLFENEINNNEVNEKKEFTMQFVPIRKSNVMMEKITSTKLNVDPLLKTNVTNEIMDNKHDGDYSTEHNITTKTNDVISCNDMEKEGNNDTIKHRNDANTSTDIVSSENLVKNDSEHTEKEKKSNVTQQEEDICAKTPQEKQYLYEKKQQNPIISRCDHPELIVIEQYQKRSDTDVSVGRGDYAVLLNDTKYEGWMYIVNEKGEKGFIPKKCAIKHECHDCCNASKRNTMNSENTPKKIDNTNKNENEEINNYESSDKNLYVYERYTNVDFEAMTRLIVTQDYSGERLDDLYVCVGDIVYMSLKEQSSENWLWVHSLRVGCSGYVPREITRKLDEIESVYI